MLADDEADEAPDVPPDLKERIAAAILKDPKLTWDGIIRSIAEDDAEADSEDAE